MSPQFELGSIVQLKSGGPKMTVSHVEDGFVHCTWFDKEGKVHIREFRVCMIVVPKAEGEN